MVVVSLSNVVRQVEQAKTELSKAAANATAWQDKQRESFDQTRMKPLNDVATSLTAALQRAEEQINSAVRMQAD